MRTAAAVLILLAAQAAWSSDEAAATRTLSTGVIISGSISPWPSPFLAVDDLHERVFATTNSELLSFSFALTDRRRVTMATGDTRLFMAPDDAALFVMKGTAAGWRLIRFDPVSLARTGIWAERGVAGAMNPVWARGRFWSVIQRDSATGTRYVLAALDPNHPARGWRDRLDASCGDYLVSSPAGHWVACVYLGTWGHVYLYHIGRDRMPTLTNISDGIQDLIDGPSFSPDGSTAVMDEPTQVPDHVVDGFYTANTADLATETHRWISQENYNLASFTPNGQSIVALDSYGYSFFFDPTDPAAPPVAGGHIPYDDTYTYGIHGVANPSRWPAFSTDHPYMYLLVDLSYSGPTTGSSWTWHLARYPLPST